MSACDVAFVSQPCFSTCSTSAIVFDVCMRDPKERKYGPSLEVLSRNPHCNEHSVIEAKKKKKLVGNQLILNPQSGFYTEVLYVRIATYVFVS